MRHTAFGAFSRVRQGAEFGSYANGAKRRLTVTGQPCIIRHPSTKSYTPAGSAWEEGAR